MTKRRDLDFGRSRRGRKFVFLRFVSDFAFVFQFMAIRQAEAIARVRPRLAWTLLASGPARFMAGTFREEMLRDAKLKPRKTAIERVATFSRLEPGETTRGPLLISVRSLALAGTMAAPSSKPRAAETRMTDALAALRRNKVDIDLLTWFEPDGAAPACSMLLVYGSFVSFECRCYKLTKFA
jgi:hypothetical protein